MLGFCPTPYPDELFHGVLCRIHKILGRPRGHTFAKLLFGGILGKTGAILPKNVEVVIKHLPPHADLTEKKIREAHTLAPLYTTFTGELHQKQLEPYNLFSCPLCRETDKEKYGETYWHRSHQVPHGKTCHEHRIPLEKAAREYRGEARNVRHYFCPDDTEWIPLEATPEEMEIHNRFNDRVQTILTTRPTIAPAHLATLAAACQIAGFGRGTKVQTERLLHFLKERLGETFLTLFCLNPDDHASKEMLAKVLRGKEPNPHRYLLFYEAFDLEIGETREMPPPKVKPPRRRPNWRPPLKRMAQTQRRHRRSYERLIEKHPEASRSQIGAMNVAAYTWLRKYDKAWFGERNSKLKFAHRTNHRTPEESDTDCLALIEKALRIAKADKKRPQRITAGYLGKLLEGRDRRRLGRNAHLPRSKALIESYKAPSERAFYKKRIKWGLENIHRRVGFRGFCQLAALRPIVDTDPEINKLAKEAHRENQDKYLAQKKNIQLESPKKTGIKN